METSFCYICNTEHDLGTGGQRICKECLSDVHLQKTYGISLDDYDDMLAAQAGVCAICHQPPIEQRLFVDHDHESGKVRGLLCRTCNVLLGFAKDDVKLLAEAIKYLSCPPLRDY